MIELIGVTKYYPTWRGRHYVFRDVTLTIERDGVIEDQIARGFQVMSKDIVEFDFENGVVDLSDSEAKLEVEGDGLVAGRDGQGFRIGTGVSLGVDRDNGAINDLDSFGLSLDMKLDGGGGTFLKLYKTMSGYLTDDGAISFRLQTDEGEFSLRTESGLIDDAWRKVGFGFDSDAGTLGIYVDGQLEASGAASGTTAGWGYDLVFGNIWGRNAADLILDNIEMDRDAAIAGVPLPILGLGEDDGEAPDPTRGLPTNDLAPLLEEVPYDDPYVVA